MGVAVRWFIAWSVVIAMSTKQLGDADSQPLLWGINSGFKQAAGCSEIYRYMFIWLYMFKYYKNVIQSYESSTFLWKSQVMFNYEVWLQVDKHDPVPIALLLQSVTFHYYYHIILHQMSRFVGLQFWLWYESWSTQNESLYKFTSNSLTNWQTTRYKKATHRPTGFWYPDKFHYKFHIKNRKTTQAFIYIYIYT